MTVRRTTPTRDPSSQAYKSSGPDTSNARQIQRQWFLFVSYMQGQSQSGISLTLPQRIGFASLASLMIIGAIMLLKVREEQETVAS